MNPIQQLQKTLAIQIPAANSALDPAEQPEASWYLDVSLEGREVHVEWRPYCGFGVTANPDVGYGEGADEVFPDLDAVTARVTDLLRSGKSTSAPPAVDLTTLRRMRGVTQSQIARSLGVRPTSIVRLERRVDMRLSTLRALVASLGAELKISARFPDGTERELTLLQDRDRNSEQRTEAAVSSR